MIMKMDYSKMFCVCVSDCVVRFAVCVYLFFLCVCVCCIVLHVICLLFFKKVAKHKKTRHEPPPLRTSARLAWLLRWSTILAFSGARALALSLMEVRAAVGHDGPTPSTAEVVGEARYAGFV